MLFYLWGLIPEIDDGFMIFFTDNAMAADARMTTMANVAAIGNSGLGVGVVVDVGVAVLDDVGVLEGVLEDPAATAVTESAVSV